MYVIWRRLANIARRASNFTQENPAVCAAVQGADMMAADGFAGAISNELYPDSLEFHDDAALRRNMRDSLEFCRIHLSQ